MSNPFSLFKLPPSSQSKERKPSSQGSTPVTQRRRVPRPSETGVYESRTDPPSPSIISPETRLPSRVRNHVSPDATLSVDHYPAGGHEVDANLIHQSFSPSTPIGKQGQGDRALFSNLRSKLKGAIATGSPTQHEGCQIESPTTATRRSEFDLRNTQATGGKRKMSHLYDTIRKQSAAKISNFTLKDDEDAVVRSENGSTPTVLRTGPNENISTPLSQPRFLFRQPATSPSHTFSPSSQTSPAKNTGCSPFSPSQPNPSLETATPQHWLKTVVLPKPAEARSGNDFGSSRIREKGSLSDRLSRVLAQRKSEEVLWRYRSNNGIDIHQPVSMTVQIFSTIRTRGIVVANCLNISNATESELPQNEVTSSQSTEKRLRLGFATYSSNGISGSRSDIDDIDVSGHGHGGERASLVVDIYEPLIRIERRLDVMRQVSSEPEITLICTRWKVRALP